MGVNKNEIVQFLLDNIKELDQYVIFCHSDVREEIQRMIDKADIPINVVGAGFGFASKDTCLVYKRSSEPINPS